MSVVDLSRSRTPPQRPVPTCNEGALLASATSKAALPRAISPRYPRKWSYTLPNATQPAARPRKQVGFETAAFPICVCLPRLDYAVHC
jgi:hypothetical protein